jgi:hypothetical protein
LHQIAPNSGTNRHQNRHQETLAIRGFLKIASALRLGECIAFTTY